MTDNLQEGDNVSWKWGSSQASGTVTEIVEDGIAQVTSKKGNNVTRNAHEGDPAVKITNTQSGNDVVKLAHELDEVKGGGESTRSTGG